MKLDDFICASDRPEHAVQDWMKRVCAGCCLLLLLLVSQLCPAQSNQKLTPDDVEAAYLYNFGKFVQWPSGPEASAEPFSICILGKDDFGPRLDDLIANESVQGRRIVVRRLESTAAVDGCEIVFIGSSEETRLSKDLDTLANKPILTVSSLPDFVSRGGMVQFLLENNRVRFAVNLASAQQTGLSLSSELLKVAVYVKRKTAQEGNP
jgi:hypothetical protein